MARTIKRKKGADIGPLMRHYLGQRMMRERKQGIPLANASTKRFGKAPELGELLARKPKPVLMAVHVTSPSVLLNKPIPSALA